LINKFVFFLSDIVYHSWLRKKLFIYFREKIVQPYARIFFYLENDT